VPLTVDTNFLNYFHLKELKALKNVEEKLKNDNVFKSKFGKNTEYVDIIIDTFLKQLIFILI